MGAVGSRSQHATHAAWAAARPPHGYAGVPLAFFPFCYNHERLSKQKCTGTTIHYAERLLQVDCVL